MSTRPRHAARPREVAPSVFRRAAVAAAVVLGLIATTLVWEATLAAFTANTKNTANTWTTGSVALGDNDSGSAIFNATGLQPQNTAERCVTVSFSGSLASTVALYATSVSGSTALANDLILTISTSPVAAGTPDPTCAASGAYTWTQAWTGSLKTFNTFTNFASAAPLSTTWTPGAPQHRAYKISYLFTPTAPVQGLTTATTFTWEARST